MAAAAPSFEALKTMISAKQLQPVYILHGEEGYYIDQLVKLFERIVPDEEKDFNQHIFYAPRIEPEKVMEVCRVVPMMAERQVVIVKEAQAVRADILNRYHHYVRNPSPTTVLVICSRGEAIKGKDLVAAAKASKAVMFESKRIPDYKIGPEIQRCIDELHLTADPKAVAMLADFVGTDLSRLHNEISKLAAILPPRARITPETIEHNIGVSKDYNTFELTDALAAKDAAKVFRIVEAFAANPKANPLPPVASTIFNLFSDLLIAYYTPDKSDSSLMTALKLRFPIQLRRYRTAMRCYNAFQVIEIINAIRRFDNGIKGNGSRRDPYQLLHELCYHILTAPGTLPA